MSGKSIYPSCISLLFSSLCARVLKFRNQGGEAHGKFSLRVYVQQILVIFVVSYFTENEYFTQLWFLLLQVMTDHTWSQACAGATFPHPCEIAAHTHGIGINASNYMLLHRYHEFMFMFTEKNDHVTKWQI